MSDRLPDITILIVRQITDSCRRFLAYGLFLAVGMSNAEPVVVKAAAVPALLGAPIQQVRLCSLDGKPLPFQIDEITADGEYVCDAGESPNSDSGNGLLNSADEIVFMREDGQAHDIPAPGAIVPVVKEGRTLYPLYAVSKGAATVVYLTADSSVGRSRTAYLTYDHDIQLLTAKRYYAQFGNNRFHFVRAGIADASGNGWVHLTRELRIELFLKALWGILPIRYSEDNLICYVKRYKIGPIRCIRRGDFHLRLGLGLKGSRAVVYQCCYPQMVSVPVKVHIPLKFGPFFSEAWLEMTPVIDTAGSRFRFVVDGCNIAIPLLGGIRNDTVMQCKPTRNPFMVEHAGCGYGWILTATIPDSLLAGSTYVVRRNLVRKGIAACGLRLLLRDIERGRYTITNRVVFSTETVSLPMAIEQVRHPCTILTAAGSFSNLVQDQ